MSKNGALDRYEVFIYNEGCAPEYLGPADTLKFARQMCHQHARGERPATPKHLWETARASGNPVEGCDYPVGHADPIEWVTSRFAKHNSYAICRQ